jgi:hypothetical protein
VKVKDGRPSKKRVATNAHQLMLVALFSKLGGITDVADLLGVERQVVHYWVKQGAVPLRRVGKVAKILKVSPWALNYKGLVEIHTPEKSPSWQEVVDSLKISTGTVKSIMALQGVLPE